MMAPDASGGKYRIMADINMIPLIDVALVLLIIFMVVTPMLVKSEIKINLPKAGSATKRPADEMLLVQVSREGTVLIHGHSVSPDLLPAMLKREVTSPETQPVVIEADKDVPFEHVVQVMDAAKRVGVQKVSVGVHPLSQADATPVRAR